MTTRDVVLVSGKGLFKTTEHSHRAQRHRGAAWNFCVSVSCGRVDQNL